LEVKEGIVDMIFNNWVFDCEGVEVQEVE